jgi:hypothetical protein
VAIRDWIPQPSLRFSFAALSVLVAAAPYARAETGDVALAEALFRDGKELLAQKDYARACPKLAESFRRDPATGTLLALAMCHEREGKIAQAWGEYADVASRSKLEARPDREKAARARAAELEQRVSKITIRLSPDYGDATKLEVTRNGAVVAAPLLGTAIPVEGGTQVVEAVAPGKKKWRAKVALASAGDTQTVTIPQLDDEDRAERPVAAAPAPPPKKIELKKVEPPKAERPAPKDEPVAATTAEPPTDAAPPIDAPPETDKRPGLAPLQRIGMATGAAGIVGLGAGAFFSFRAVSKNNDSKTGCSGDLCLPAAKQDRLDARSAGNIATIGLISGGVLTAAGVTMYILGRRPSAPASPQSRSIEAIPVVGPDAVGGVLRGTF